MPLSYLKLFTKVRHVIFSSSANNYYNIRIFKYYNPTNFVEILQLYIYYLIFNKFFFSDEVDRDKQNDLGTHIDRIKFRLAQLEGVKELNADLLGPLSDLPNTQGSGNFLVTTSNLIDLAKFTSSYSRRL